MGLIDRKLRLVAAEAPVELGRGQTQAVVERPEQGGEVEVRPAREAPANLEARWDLVPGGSMGAKRLYRITDKDMLQPRGDKTPGRASFKLALDQTTGSRSAPGKV